MKFTVGGYSGRPLPRVVNPVVFGIGAAFAVIGAIAAVVVAALLVILVPFSFFFKVRVE